MTKTETKKKTTPKKTTTTKKKTNSIKTKSIPKLIQEENNYGKTLLAALLIIVVLLSSYFIIQNKQKDGEGKETSYVQTENEKRFKEEYESLNNTKRSNGIDHKNITIVENNNIEYIDMKRASEIISNESGIIYFGFAACPWCRNAVPVLLEAMENAGLDKIYYVDLKKDDLQANDVRGTYKLNEKGNKAIVDIQSAEGYKEVLKALDKYLPEYTLTNKNGKKISTGEKRLGGPTVVVVKDGKVLDYHAGTVEGHVKDENGVLPDLTKEQKENLYEKYSEMIMTYQDDTCPIDGDVC